MPSLIAGLPARPTPAIRPSLIPMSALTTPISGIDDDRADDHGVELRRADRARLGQPEPDVLRVAPDRLVAERLAILLDADPEVRVAEPDAVAGRRPEARRCSAGERRLTLPCRRVPSRPHRRTGRASPPRLSPGAQRSDEPASRSRRKPGRGRPIELEPRVHPVEREVRRDADDAPRGVRDAQLGVARAMLPAPPARPARRRPRRARPGPVGAPRPSGSTSVISRVPSSSRTSRRHQVDQLAHAGHDVGGRHGRETRRFHVRVARARPRRLEHRVADQRDRLGRVERDARGAMPPRQLGGAEDAAAAPPPTASVAWPDRSERAVGRSLAMRSARRGSSGSGRRAPPRGRAGRELLVDRRRRARRSASGRAS